jgi:hypothetical protein
MSASGVRPKGSGSGTVGVTGRKSSILTEKTGRDSTQPITAIIGDKTDRPEWQMTAVEKMEMVREGVTRKVNLAENGGNFRLDIYDQIDDYIRSKERKVCEDMPRIYRNMRDHLKSFQDFGGTPITFETLDLNFYEEFVDFLTYDYVQKSRSKKTGLKINTIGRTIKQLRTFLRNRMRKRIIPRRLGRTDHTRGRSGCDLPEYG